MASHALSTYSSGVFYLKTRRSEIAQTATGIPRRAIPTPPPRSLATARVASPRAPSASTSGDGDDEDPRVFTIGEDGEFVALDAARTSSEDRARDAPVDDDDWALDSAVEVIRGPDGDVLFRFTGDAEEHYNAAVAFASEEDARAEPEPEPEPTPAQRAQALLDEAQALIEEAKRIRAEDEVAVAAAAKRAAETIAPDTEGTRIMRRPARSVTPARPDASALGGLAAASKLGIKSIVDGIEGMFSNFRRKADASTRPSVRIPTAPKDSPWKEHPGDAPPASALDAAFDAFATDAAAAETDAIVVDADSEDAAMAEEMEEEHAEWEDAAARAMISGNVSSVASEPEEEAPESALERYESMGSVVAGMWRPKPLDVTINGREFIAYITPNNIKQLPSGEYVVGDEDDDVVGDRVGETTTIIMCEPQEDGTNVFMFGLTRTVLPDGSVLYRFPSGETLG